MKTGSSFGFKRRTRSTIPSDQPLPAFLRDGYKESGNFIMKEKGGDGFYKGHGESRVVTAIEPTLASKFKTIAGAIAVRDKVGGKLKWKIIDLSKQGGK